MNISLKWHLRFLELAKHVAEWSKDKSSKVGAVAVDTKNKNPVSLGYNGFPENIDDNNVKLQERPEKYYWTIHAEENVLFNANRTGVCLDRCFLYCTHAPCVECAKGIIRSGIAAVIIPENTTEQYIDFVKRTKESLTRAQTMFHMCGVDYVKIYQVNDAYAISNIKQKDFDY
jgi:dCMP deaminase